MSQPDPTGESPVTTASRSLATALSKARFASALLRLSYTTPGGTTQTRSSFGIGRSGDAAIRRKPTARFIENEPNNYNCSVFTDCESAHNRTELHIGLEENLRKTAEYFGGLTSTDLLRLIKESV